MRPTQLARARDDGVSKRVKCLPVKLRDALAAIQVCGFLFGTAWLDRAFEEYHVPPLVAEVHKPDAATLLPDDGEQAVINLTVPLQLPPVSNFVSASPQISDRSFAAIFDTSPSANVPLMLHMLARRMPVLYVPPQPAPGSRLAPAIEAPSRVQQARPGN